MCFSFAAGATIISVVFFAPRVSKNENVAFVSVMAAVNVLLSVVASFLPLGGLLVMLLLPPASALTGLLCKGRYCLIYAVASLGLSLAVTAYNYESTLFYTFPSIVVGLVFGYLSKKGLPLSLLTLLSSLAYTGIVYACLPLIDFLYGINPVTLLLTVMGIADNSFGQALFPAIVFCYASLATALSAFVISLEFGRFKADFAPENAFPFLFPALTVFFTATTLAGAFYLPSLCYVSFLMSIYSGLMSLATIHYSGSKAGWVVFGFGCFVSLILMAAIYSYLPYETAATLASLYFLSAGIGGLTSAIISRQGKGNA